MVPYSFFPFISNYSVQKLMVYKVMEVVSSNFLSTSVCRFPVKYWYLILSSINKFSYICHSVLFSYVYLMGVCLDLEAELLISHFVNFLMEVYL